jgi:hypothetical protein
MALLATAKQALQAPSLLKNAAAAWTQAADHQVAPVALLDRRHVSCSACGQVAAAGRAGAGVPHGCADRNPVRRADEGRVLPPAARRCRHQGRDAHSGRRHRP